MSKLWIGLSSSGHHKNLKKSNIDCTSAMIVTGSRLNYVKTANNKQVWSWLFGETAHWSFVNVCTFYFYNSCTYVLLFWKTSAVAFSTFLIVVSIIHKNTIFLLQHVF